MNVNQYLLCNSTMFPWHEMSQNVWVTGSIICSSAQEEFQRDCFKSEALTGDTSKCYLLHKQEVTCHHSSCLEMTQRKPLEKLHFE